MPSIDKLHALFNAGETLTLDEASEEIGVSRKQVRRNIRKLRTEGVRIHEETRDDGLKHFWLDEDDRDIKTAVNLRRVEWKSLIAAVAAAKATLGDTPLRDELQNALDLLLEEVDQSFRKEVLGASETALNPSEGIRAYEDLWYFDHKPVSLIDGDVFQRVADAAQHYETLAIDYTSASSGEVTHGRRITPLILSDISGSWLVAAYCHTNEDIRDFAIARISNVQRADGSLPPEAFEFDPDDHFGDRFGALKGDGDHQVRIEVPADKATYFHTKLYHTSQQIATEHDDGRLEVTFETSSLNDIAAFIRSWGPDVRVLEPAELADRIAREAAETAAMYRNGAS